MHALPVHAEKISFKDISDYESPNKISNSLEREDGIIKLHNGYLFGNKFIQEYFSYPVNILNDYNGRSTVNYNNIFQTLKKSITTTNYPFYKNNTACLLQ
ncbi:hypothetical protein AYI70_g488 [Smittium culicis]|uniref:Uncharacterized protein n=1 Tax=Smittium culicis TaxID=133412 RepID=A0A1R1YH28_9FUNG|nr:hypothetical protein AYI70_g488 [Smittium culicis]